MHRRTAAFGEGPRHAGVDLAADAQAVDAQALHDRAVKLLGHPGVSDVVTLMGYYTMVSLTMNFYAVPAGTPGISR